MFACSGILEAGAECQAVVRRPLGQGQRLRSFRRLLAVETSGWFFETLKDMEGLPFCLKQAVSKPPDFFRFFFFISPQIQFHFATWNLFDIVSRLAKKSHEETGSLTSWFEIAIWFGSNLKKNNNKSAPQNKFSLRNLKFVYHEYTHKKFSHAWKDTKSLPFMFQVIISEVPIRIILDVHHSNELQ